MWNQQPPSRRQFLSRGTAGAALLGMGGVLASPTDHSKAPSTLADGRPERFATGARRARKIAVGPEDRICVAADQAVLVFDRDGSRRSRIELNRPARCLAFRGDGNLLVGLLDHLEVYDANGHCRARWESLGERAVVSGITVAGEDVFVADAGNQVVWRYRPEGTRADCIKPTPQGFVAPAEFFTVAASPSGIHVGNPGRHRIETYTVDGRFVSAWGERSRLPEGFSGCCNPVSFAVLPDGRFATAERGLPRVKLYDAEGRFLELLAGPEQFDANARASSDEVAFGCHTGGLDIAIDSRNRVVVLDRVTAEVLILS